MTTISVNFPLTRAARKEELKKIKEEKKSITTAKVPGKGSLPVYKIPLKNLSYNPYNTRFLAQAKTLEKRFGTELSDENPEHVKEIEKFIWEERKDRNRETIDSLIRDGQIHPGVVTADGIILAGNRRFRLLNEIARNPEVYISDRTSLDGLEFFEAVILDEEIDKKTILRYESFYQYGTDEKVEYDPIQKYIAAARSRSNEINFSEEEIAQNFRGLTKGKKSEVKKWLEVYELMEEYLDYIGENSIFTALKGREEAFLQLHSTLNSLKGQGSNKVEWAFDERDVDDFKISFYNYIRLNIPTHNFRDFKKFFYDEKQWKRFYNATKNIIELDSNNIDDFEEYRKKHTEDDETKISERRQHDYRDKVEKSLNEIYKSEKHKAESRELEEKPLDIVASMQNNLKKLEDYMIKHPKNEIYYTDEFFDAVNDVRKRIGRIKKDID